MPVSSPHSHGDGDRSLNPCAQVQSARAEVKWKPNAQKQRNSPGRQRTSLRRCRQEALLASCGHSCVVYCTLEPIPPEEQEQDAWHRDRGWQQSFPCLHRPPTSVPASQQLPLIHPRVCACSIDKLQFALRAIGSLAANLAPLASLEGPFLLDRIRCAYYSKQVIFLTTVVPHHPSVPGHSLHGRPAKLYQPSYPTPSATPRPLLNAATSFCRGDVPPPPLRSSGLTPFPAHRGVLLLQAIERITPIWPRLTIILNCRDKN